MTEDAPRIDEPILRDLSSPCFTSSLHQAPEKHPKSREVESFNPSVFLLDSNQQTTDVWRKKSQGNPWGFRGFPGRTFQVVAERKPAFEKILRYLLRSDAVVHEPLGGGF